MKDVSAAPSRPVQALEPVNEDPLETLQDKLVPVQEEELPQGVLDLMASLIRPHRSTMETGHAAAWHSMTAVRGTVDIERDGARPIVQRAKPFPQAGPLFSESMHHRLPQRLASAVSALDGLTVPTAPVSIEPMSLDPSSGPAASSDEQLPQAPLSLQAIRHTPPVAQIFIPSPTMPPPLPVPETLVEALPGPERGLLQVPFSRGAASGQVTISRASEESPRKLTLSPSNTLVFEQLKAPFERAQEPAWRLADRGDEQSRQGSHQAPDEDQDDQPGLPA
jgi:hypothetical protein